MVLRTRTRAYAPKTVKLSKGGLYETRTRNLLYAIETRSHCANSPLKVFWLDNLRSSRDSSLHRPTETFLTLTVLGRPICGLVYVSIQTSNKYAGMLPLTQSQSGGIRTRDLTYPKRVRYHCATPCKSADEG